MSCTNIDFKKGINKLPEDLRFIILSFILDVYINYDYEYKIDLKKINHMNKVQFSGTLELIPFCVILSRTPEQCFSSCDAAVRGMVYHTVTREVSHYFCTACRYELSDFFGTNTKNFTTCDFFEIEY